MNRWILEVHAGQAAPGMVPPSSTIPMPASGVCPQGYSSTDLLDGPTVCVACPAGYFVIGGSPGGPVCAPTSGLATGAGEWRTNLAGSLALVAIVTGAVYGAHALGLSWPLAALAGLGLVVVGGYIVVIAILGSGSGLGQ